MRTTVNKKKHLLGKKDFPVYNKQNKIISVEDVIDAYEQGVKDGVDNLISKMNTKVINNLEKVLPIVSDFLNTINKEDNHFCKLVVLKMLNPERFDFIAALDDNVFANDSLCRPIYEKSFEVENCNSMIGLSFMPFTDNINKEALMSDGYIICYNG